MQEGIDPKSVATTALEEWGRWACVRSIDLGFPHQATFRRLLGSIVPEPTITDAQGSQIDRMISQLKDVDELAHKMAVAVWVLRLPIRTAATVLNTTQRPAENAKLFAVAWLAGALSQPVDLYKQT